MTDRQERAKQTRIKNKQHQEQRKKDVEAWELEQIAVLKRIATSTDSSAAEVLEALDRLNKFPDYQVAQVK
jgi:hypothetical protein